MRVPRDHNQRLKRFARELRARSTDAERRVWAILRDRRFEAFKFRRQVPIGGYIVDFYCVKARLVIELDGGQHATVVAKHTTRSGHAHWRHSACGSFDFGTTTSWCGRTPSRRRSSSS